MKIGDIIKEHRIKYKLTQDDLAMLVGTTKSTVSRWESGDIHKMKRSMIDQLSAVLGLDPAIFFQREEVLLPDEYKLISAYRTADEGTRSAVRKLLDVNKKREEPLQSAV